MNKKQRTRNWVNNKQVLGGSKNKKNSDCVFVWYNKYPILPFIFREEICKIRNRNGIIRNDVIAESHWNYNF